MADDGKSWGLVLSFGAGTPLEGGGPEWDSVEQERDYWKALAQQHAAKLAAIQHALSTDWGIAPDETGKMWVVSSTDPANVRPMPTLKDVLE